jgi:hypothetical protein
MARVVIMVWMQNLNAGLGDMLRGTVYLHQLSQKMNFKLIVDTQLHPMSHMLGSRPHEYSNYVIENQSKIIHAINLDANNHLIVNSIQTHLKLLHSDPILITTNHNHNVSLALSHECKQFMRSMLVPNDEFKAYFNDTCNALKIPEHYSIIHVRLGDDDLVTRSFNIANYNKLFDIVHKHLSTTPSMFIITDSAQFKEYLKRTIDPALNDRIIKTAPIHLSYANAANNMKRIKETLFDFMLLTNATIIKTHSTYGWVSGFVQWVSCIFNVPLVNLKTAIQSIFHRMQSTQSTQSQSTMILMKPMKQIHPRQLMQIMQIMPMRASSRLMKIKY